MESYEVAVVGGGPAGSTCARLLAKWGVSVLLLDKETFPRPKPCAGWVTPDVFERLEIDPQRYRERCGLQEIQRFRTGLIYGEEIETAYPSAVSYGITRYEFDRFLLDACESAKSLGEPVKALERTPRGWLVNGRVQAAMLVGAGGHNCPVSRALGARPASEEAIAAMVTEFELEENACGLPAGVPHLYFSRDLRGYGWALRKGNLVNVGLGSLTPGVRGEALAFCAYIGKRFGIKERLMQRMRGHAYLPYLGPGGRKLVAENALLVGDAAGLSYPESGEGILPAVESGIFAARAIREAQGDYREERLELYAKAIRARFAGNGTGLPLPAALRRLGGRLILTNSYLTRRLVLDRWFLHRQ